VKQKSEMSHMSKQSSVLTLYKLSVKHNFYLYPSGRSVALCAGGSFFGESTFRNFADTSTDRIRKVTAVVCLVRPYLENSEKV
jgi:hypothetical protein